MKKFICLFCFFFLLFIGYAPNLSKHYTIAIQKEIEKEKQRIDLLAKAFTIVESNTNYKAIGQNGEIGAYQFSISTWNLWCKRIFGKVLDISIPSNQDKVAKEKIKRLVKAGYSNEQIASIWNCGKSDYKGMIGINSKGVKYNVPAYVAKIINQIPN